MASTSEERHIDESIVPSSLRNLRACTTCNLIKTHDQFFDQGCENCPTLGMKHDPQRIAECTATEFEGMHAMIRPSASWVSRWGGRAMLEPGLYALRVEKKKIREDEEDLLGEEGENEEGADDVEGEALDDSKMNEDEFDRSQ